jgi:hypothetical protein
MTTTLITTDHSADPSATTETVALSGATIDPTGSTGATRRMLAAGAVAGPLLAAVWIAQGLVRDGYDFTRHPMSLLALGGGGWVQIANFVVCGALVIAGAAGMRRIMTGSPGGTWAPRMAGLVGIGLIAAGVFRCDPGSGFPAGAPEGMPDLTVTGMLHGLALTVNLSGFVAGALVLRRHFGRRGDQTWARVCVAVIPTVFVLFGVPHEPSFPTRLVVLTLVILGFLNVSARRSAR